MPEGIWLQAALGGLFGLLIGSFLNVVIYRLPKMMERQWAAECAQLNGAEPEHTTPFNLNTPRSHCQQCKHQIRWFENIPIASYLFLRGKCSSCRTPISLRYPLVELATGALFFVCIWRWGMTPTGWAWSGFSAALLTLALIDWDTTLLPDDITLPLLWAGLVAGGTLGAFSWLRFQAGALWLAAAFAAVLTLASVAIVQHKSRRTA